MFNQQKKNQLIGFAPSWCCMLQRAEEGWNWRQCMIRFVAAILLFSLWFHRLLLIFMDTLYLVYIRYTSPLIISYLFGCAVLCCVALAYIVFRIIPLPLCYQKFYTPHEYWIKTHHPNSIYTFCPFAKWTNWVRERAQLAVIMTAITTKPKPKTLIYKLHAVFHGATENKWIHSTMLHRFSLHN